MGIEDEGYSRANGQVQVNQSLSLLNLEDLDDIESKLTSASSKKQKIVAGSLSTVLGQALTSDDTETLDWIL